MTDARQKESAAVDPKNETRRDSSKVLKLTDRKRLRVLECTGHQFNKELAWKTKFSVLHARVVVSSAASVVG